MLYIRLCAILLILATALAQGAKQNPAPAASSCGAVEQALSATKQISVGKHRRDVERLFERDGGMLSPSATRYTYSQCRFLHIDVEFEAAKNEHPFSADDPVISVSRLYVEYPAKD